VHVKDPPSLIRRTGSRYFMGLYGSGYLCRSVEIRPLFPGLNFIHLDLQQLGRLMGHMPSSPSVGHPGLPDLCHVVDIPIKYTHNRYKGGTRGDARGANGPGWRALSVWARHVVPFAPRGPYRMVLSLTDFSSGQNWSGIFSLIFSDPESCETNKIQK
jgi:hypothetical protein